MTTLCMHPDGKNKERKKMKSHRKRLVLVGKRGKVILSTSLNITFDKMKMK